eukprot:scaffold51160_cov78-Phaeocystis_antarctica.AAC.4
MDFNIPLKIKSVHVLNARLRLGILTQPNTTTELLGASTRRCFQAGSASSTRTCGRRVRGGDAQVAPFAVKVERAAVRHVLSVHRFCDLFNTPPFV